MEGSSVAKGKGVGQGCPSPPQDQGGETKGGADPAAGLPRDCMYAKPRVPVSQHFRGK